MRFERRPGKAKKSQQKRDAKRLGSGDGQIVVDVADVLATFHVDVATIAPRRAPRVADEPRLSIITNGGDGVVDRGAGARSSEDTAGVSAEGRAGIDGDGHWLSVEQVLEGGLALAVLGARSLDLVTLARRGFA